MSAVAYRIRRFLRDRSGVAATEFALAMPFLLGAGLMGLETANRALVQMQVSQLAVQIADNASRIGDTSTLEDRKIYERDINDLFYGAHVQSSAGVDLLANGRVILSSLQVVDGTEEQQYIAWQRCMGVKRYDSTYGEAGDGLTTAIVGMGPKDEEVIAFKDDAVMFVEVAYDYQPIIGEVLAFGTHEMTAISSFTVRDDRDLTQIYQRNPSDPDTVADCDVYSGSEYETTLPDSGSSSSGSSTSTTSSGGTTTSGGSSASSSGSTTTSGGSTSSGSTSGGGTSSGSTSGGSSGGSGGGGSSGGCFLFIFC